MTLENIPLSKAAAIVYAINGCPDKYLMFLSGTLREPLLAGINATMLGVSTLITMQKTHHQ